MLVKFETGPIDISFETYDSITQSFNPEIPAEDAIEEIRNEDGSIERIYENCFGGQDEYTLNQDGLIVDIKYNGSGSVARRTYQYDNKNRVIKILSMEDNDCPLSQKSIQYKDGCIKVFYKFSYGNIVDNEITLHEFSEKTYKKTIKFDRDGKRFDRTISFTKKEKDNEIFIGTEIIADGTYSTEKKILIVSNED